jgi:hypothetical protein
MNELKNTAIFPPTTNKKIIAEIQRHLEESSAELDINRKINEIKKREREPAERRYKFEVNQSSKEESQDVKK